jgi:glycosyltransferase 2 family protein
VKKYLFILIKVSLSVAILGYLIHGAMKESIFKEFVEQPKNYWSLLAALGFCSFAVLLTMIRWHLLVRALEIPVRLTGSLRIAMLGYLFNLAPAGIVGGDVLKAVLLCRSKETPGGSTAKAFASVVLDRVLGLYMLFVVASITILAADIWQIDNPVIWKICLATWSIAIVGGVIGILLMIPAMTEGSLTNWLEKHPKLGHPFSRLMEAVRLYRGRPKVLIVASLMTVCVHLCFAVGVYFVSRGLFASTTHSLPTHLVVSPLSMAAGAIPLPVGPFETLLGIFYNLIPLGTLVVPKGQGLVVAFGYRLITIVIAAIGAVVYLSARQEIGQAIHELQPDEQDEPKDEQLADRPKLKTDPSQPAGAHFDAVRTSSSSMSKSEDEVA